MCGGVLFVDWCRLGTFALELETTLLAYDCIDLNSNSIER